MKKHNHFTRDIKPMGECPACDLISSPKARANYKINGNPLKNLIDLIEEINRDCDNGEHVDEEWIRDTFELARYKILTLKEYWELVDEKKRDG